MEKKKYIQLQDLEIYQLARELSKIAWQIYEQLKWEDKKTMGNQFLESTDSIGANIAEGYRRYHYLDQIKFYYNARGSLAEANDHWLALLYERQRASTALFDEYRKISARLSLKLQNFINAAYKAKNN